MPAAPRLSPRYQSRRGEPGQAGPRAARRGRLQDGSAEKAVALGRREIRQARHSRQQRRPYHYKLVVDMSREDWNCDHGGERHRRLPALAGSHEGDDPQEVRRDRQHRLLRPYFAFPQIAAYTASKGALAQLTRTLALEAIEHGIRVNAIGSATWSPTSSADIMEDGHGFLADHGGNAPIGRAAKPKRSPRSLPSWRPIGRASSSARSSWPMAE